MLTNALASCALGVFVAGVPGWKESPDPPNLLDLLQRQVHAEAERLKRQLSELEAQADYGLLLERKLTVDASLIAALLLEDAALFCAAVEDGREPPDLLSLLRTEHGAAPVQTTWSDEQGPTFIAKALAGWAAPADGAAACVASTASMRAPKGESAPFIRWSAHVSRRDGGVAVAAQAHWHEPCLEAMHLDWPLLPHALRVAWDGESGSIATASGERHAERWAPSPHFNNPGDVYALFDALRSRRCGDVRVERARDPAGAAPPLTSPDADAHAVTRALHRADGTLVRTERWVFDGDALKRLTFEQPPLRLQHDAAEAFEIGRQVEGVAIDAPEVFRPRSVLAYPTGGLHVRIDFRPSDPSRDALPATNGVTVPAEVAVYAGGVLRARIALLGIASGAGADGRMRVDRALAGWQAAADASGAARLQSMRAVDAACAMGDATRVRLECAHLALLAQVDEVPELWANANLAACRRRLLAASYPVAAAELRDDAPYVPQGFDAEDPGSGARGAPSQAGAEGLPALSAGREAFVAAIRDGLRRGLGSQRHAHAIEAAITALAARAMRDAPADLQQTIDGLTPIVGADLCAIIQEGIGEFSAIHAADPATLTEPAQRAEPAQLDDLCRHFDARLQAALRAAAPADDMRSRLRRAVRTGADAARDVARAVATSRGEPPTIADIAARRAHASVLQLEHLAGNCLAPSLLGDWIAGESTADLAKRAREGPHLMMALRALDAMPRDGRLGARHGEELGDAVAGSMRGVLCAPTAARLRVERPAEAPAVRP